MTYYLCAQKLPFEGPMAAVVFSVVYKEAEPLSERYSLELRELVS